MNSCYDLMKSIAEHTAALEAAVFHNDLDNINSIIDARITLLENLSNFITDDKNVKADLKKFAENIQERDKCIVLKMQQVHSDLAIKLHELQLANKASKLYQYNR
jgi:hypothetical protein